MSFYIFIVWTFILFGRPQMPLRSLKIEINNDEAACFVHADYINVDGFLNRIQYIHYSQDRRNG